MSSFIACPALSFVQHNRSHFPALEFGIFQRSSIMCPKFGLCLELEGLTLWSPRRGGRSAAMPCPPLTIRRKPNGVRLSDATQL